MYETLIKAKSFTQGDTKTVKVKEQVPVQVRTAKVQKVQVIKEVPVIAYKEVIKQVKVIQEVPVEVIREVKVIKEVPIEVIKEVVREVKVKVPVVKVKEIVKKVPIIKVKEVIKKVPVVKVKEVIKKVPVEKKVKVVDTKQIDKLTAKIADLKQKLAAKPKTVEVIREVPVEIIKEVEVVKQIDFASLAKMMKGMKQVEVSKKVIGESTVRGQEKIVERRELKPGEKGTKITGKATKVKKDDLTKIEGIGPKIAQILNKEGINSFKGLSKSKISKLKAILDNAGPKFQMHDPSTWAEQAALAADGKWKRLKTLQDNLDGGRR